VRLRRDGNPADACGVVGLAGDGTREGDRRRTEGDRRQGTGDRCALWTVPCLLSPVSSPMVFEAIASACPHVPYLSAIESTAGGGNGRRCELATVVAVSAPPTRDGADSRFDVGRERRVRSDDGRARLHGVQGQYELRSCVRSEGGMGAGRVAAND